MVGTDTPLLFMVPGLSLHQEMEVMVEAGLSPLQVIKSASYNPSRYFATEDQLGLIRENYIADLILLNSNPLEQINNSRDIFAVIKNGRYLDREHLDSLLQPK